MSHMRYYWPIYQGVRCKNDPQLRDPSQDVLCICANAVLQVSCKFGESKGNPHCVIELPSSFDMNYIIYEHEDFGQYGPYKTLSGIMWFYSYHASLVNQKEITNQLSC